MIKQHRVTGYASTRTAIQAALRAEGVPESIRRHVTFNGAVPGDGIAKGSLMYGGGPAWPFTRVYAWREVESVVNDPAERAKLAAWARAAEERRKLSAHPISRATYESPSVDGLGVLLWRWWIFRATEQLSLFYRPDERPNPYMARLETVSGGHVATEYFGDADSALDYLQQHGINLRGYKPRLPVLFRIERRKGGEVTAVFPTLPADMDGREVTVYAHIGQHGGASWGWYHATTHRLAKPAEYADLLAELSGIYGESHADGDPAYTLVPVARRTDRHRAEFDRAIRMTRVGCGRSARATS